MNNNVTILLFGASGDLAKRKLIPALYHLVATGFLKKFALIGFAKEKITAHEMLERARPFISGVEEKQWELLQNHSFYKTVDFTSYPDYQEAVTFVQETETTSDLSGNRLAYLATSADFFCDITKYATQSGIIAKRLGAEKPWHRIVYEKPFGHDVASAHQINQCIESYLEESQVFRIDHYLTKEVVSNIALIRFTNIVFEPLWNNKFIDSVQIILSEDIGIEQRGSYYDKYGVLADVVQNHVLELLALIAMEAPSKLTGDHIRSKRADVLEKVRVAGGVLGQYEGYKREAHVSPESNTETFAALQLFVENERWAGVPFYVKAGKKLEKKETVVYIQFKKAECLMMHGCPLDANCLTLQVSPQAVFSLRLNAKKPGKSNELVPIDMEFCHSCVFGQRQSEPYEILLQEVIRGEQSVSVRFDEIEYAWKIIDTIKKMKFPVYLYEQNSNGPEQVTTFEQKHDMRFRS